MNKIITFIITDRNDNGFVESIYSAKNIMDYGNGVVLHEAKYLKTIIDHTKDDFQFRVLIHASTSTGSGFNFLQELEDEFNTTNFTLISRKTELFPQQEEFVLHKGKKIYNTEKINKKKFIDDLPIITNGNIVSINSSTENKTVFDFAIITALHDDEFTSLKEVFSLIKSADTKLGDKNIYTGSINGKSIIAIYQTNVGMQEAATLTTEVIKEYSPKYIFMTGVCGGTPDLTFGSIVIGKFIFTFNKGKINDEGFFREIELVKTEESLLRKLTENKEDILSDVKSTIIGNANLTDKFKSFDFQNLKAIIDPIACSSFVINKENYFKDVIQSIERKATAVEMESYGVARSAETTNRGLTKSLIIKSVMDNTTKKQDGAKNFASYTSALFLKKLLEKNILD